METLAPRTLLLARHGETSWNEEGRWQGHTDIPLSPRGRAQAAALAERLRDFDVKHIRSSDLLRAKETAEIVARALGVAEVIVDPRLRERGFGAFEGLTRDECASRFPDIWAAYESDRRIMPKGSEVHDVVIGRLEQGVRHALETTAGLPGALLIVGHGGSLRLLLAAAFGRTFPPIGNAGLLRLRAVGQRLEHVEDLGI